jgi:hypothetical protein
MPTGTSGSDLSAFQLEVARLFFALPASQGFLLAGGAALLAQHLTVRPTEDLDFFTAPGHGHVLAARDAQEAAARQRNWSVQRIHDSDTFCRMVIRSADDGSWLTWPCTHRRTFPRPRPQPGRRWPGGTRGPQAARPVRPSCCTGLRRCLRLADRFGKGVLLARAAQIDAGFDSTVLADMIATLERFTDDELPVPDGSSAADLRAFYAAWRSELAT